MGVMHAFRVLTERLTETVILRELPRGVNLFADIRLFLPRFQCDVIFDVGANIGQSAQEFVKECPTAIVHCFEPVSSTSRELQTRFANAARVNCHRVALGETNGIAQMIVEGASDRAHLAREIEGSRCGDEDVEIVMLDSFCEANKIEHISFLKIDTEGADLDVLLGAEEKLSAQHVDIIQVEAGMNSHNRVHVPFEQFRVHFDERSYYLFGIYEQVSEWPTGRPNLRRTNPVFISERIIEENRLAR